MRFSKGCHHQLSYPLYSVPATSDGLVSPVQGSNALILPDPDFPGVDSFQEKLYEVMRVRHDVTQGIWPSWFFEAHDIDPRVPEPLRFAGISEDVPENAAHIVHMDAPTDLGKFIRAWLGNEGNSPSISGHAPFIDTVPNFFAALGVNTAVALEEAFKVKYFYGRPRPEELMGFNMTHYPEGCPKHPEYPAGHGAAAGATYGTFVHMFNLNEEQLFEIKLACLHFAMYRTLAGVHYGDANLAGFALGFASTEGLARVNMAVNYGLAA